MKRVASSDAVGDANIAMPPTNPTAVDAESMKSGSISLTMMRADFDFDGVCDKKDSVREKVMFRLMDFCEALRDEVFDRVG